MPNRRQRSTGGRRLLRGLAISLAILAALALAALAALHLPWLQRGLFDRATAAAEARSGLRLTAESVRLSPLRGRIELGRPRAAAAAAPPFMSAERLTVEVSPLSLLGRRPVVREVVLERPRFDAAQPLPAFGGGAGAASGAPAIEVRRLVVTDGTFEGLALPEGLRPYASMLRADGIGLSGRLADERLELRWQAAAVRLERPDAEPLLLRLEGGLRGPPSGPLEIHTLRLEGDALSGSLTGLVGLEAGQPLSASVDLEVDPAALLAVPALGAPLRLVGTADLRAESARLRLEAPDLAAELLRPWLAEELYVDASLPGSRIGLAADLLLEAGSARVDAELGWRRGEQLVEAAVSATSVLPLEQLTADVDLVLLPQAPGRRRLAARLQLPVADPAGGSIEHGTVDVDSPSVSAELARLRRLWPAWVPAPPQAASGELRATGHLSGRLSNPVTRLDVTWKPVAESSVRLRAGGRPLARVLTATLVVERLPLALAAPELSGRIDGSGRLTLSAGRQAGNLHLMGLDLRYGELAAERVEITAALDGRTLSVGELVAVAGERRLAGAGEIDLEASTGAFELSFTGPLGPLSAAEGRVGLAAGEARIEVTRAVVGDESGSLMVVLPLGTLARLPGAAGLASLPLPAADGPLRVEWSLPPLDWAALLAPAAADEPRRWRAGSHGRLSFAPDDLGAALAEVAISGLAIEEAGHRVEVDRPVRLALAAGELRLEPLEAVVDGRTIVLAGGARLAPGWSPQRPVGELVEELRLDARTALPAPLEAVSLALGFAGESWDLDAEVRYADGRSGSLTARLPAPTLAALASGTDAAEVEPVRLAWELPAVGWGPLLEGLLPAEERPDQRPPRLVAGSHGRLAVDPLRPALSSGQLEITGLEAEAGGQLLRGDGALRLRLDAARIEVGPLRLLASGAPFELVGGVDLDPAWSPASGAGTLVRELSLTGHGVLPAAMANPFLAGGTAEGTLIADLEIAGPLDAVRGRLEVSGPGVALFFASPYTVKIDSPRLSAAFDGSGAVELAGEARINDGVARFEGRPLAGGGLELRTRLEGVRALLDYGLRAVLDGDLKLALQPSGGGELSGRLTVDRGELTRPIALHGELLGQLLGPVDLLGTEESPLEAIALDLSLDTRQGVRIRNNLADLKVRWEPLAIRGNLLLPTIEGRLEVDPGGLIYAYGQTVRLDSAAIVYAGEAGETPSMEVETTTSLEDPAIGRLAGGDPFGLERGGDDAAASPEAVAGELATYLGEQLAGSLSESLGGTRISFRPLLIFGEADPSARFTLSRDVSAFATLAASVDLRNAERQTYLLDLHDFEAAPFLTGRLFTNDEGNDGATVQQRLRFGGGDRAEEGLRIRRLQVERPPGIGRRALRRAVGYRKGDRLPDGGDFEIEVQVAELLRRRGYPDARVRARATPVEGRPRLDLEVTVDSGPRVEFVFTGERPPGPLREAVTTLYRGGFYEPVALEEMRTQAVRAWRSRGHLEPQVRVERELLEGGPPERRRVTVHSEPGRRIEPGPPEFAGLPPPEAADLAALFATPLQRLELAAGLPAAERRALSGLAALGYPQATIAGRELSEDGRRLLLRIEPGERLEIVAIELLYESRLRTEVEEAGGLAAGDPARADRLARAALEVERELRESGYVDAEVRLRLVPAGPERPHGRTAVFEVERGRRHLVAGTGFEGLEATRSRWAARVAGLAAGEPLRPSDLRSARRRLYGTELFSVVGSRTEQVADGGSEVVFEVAERPRFRLAYGLRWESEEGSSLVVDLLDHNFFGRGVDVGLRALWSEDIQRLRLSASIPGLLGPRSSLDLFGLGEEREELVDDGEILQFTRTTETTLQLGWRLGERSTGRLYGRYREVLFRETFLVEDPVFGFPDPIELEVRRPFLGVQFLYDSRDEPAAPSRGLFASVDFSFSDEAIGGDLRYARLFGQVNSFRAAGRLARRQLTWAQSVRLGRAEAFDQQLTSDQLLLAGGEYSVRGYLRETVGPPELRQVRPRGIETNTLLVLNEELRFELWDPVSALVFVDAGNVWISDLDLDLFTSVGFGLRARTPFGLLRLDLAYPLDRRDGVDPEYKLYLGLGNVF